MLVITEERQRAGLSKSALARKADMNVSSVTQIESGRLKPYPGQVEKLVAALEWTGDPAALFEEVKEGGGDGDRHAA